MERERGALYDHPVPVDFLTPEEYSERTRTDEGDLSDEDKAEMEQFEGSLRALGILAADVDLLEASNELSDSGTLAYYDPAEERVVVRGTEVTPGLAVTLVHELTHVLQDQVFALDRYEEGDEEPTSGEVFAFNALVEGDADRIEEIYIDSLDQAVQDAIEAENEAGFEEYQAADIPAALDALFGAIYGLGDSFLAILESVRGESVDGAFDDPPVSEEQVFDPFSYLDDDDPAAGGRAWHRRRGGVPRGRLRRRLPHDRAGRAHRTPPGPGRGHRLGGGRLRRVPPGRAHVHTPQRHR